MRHGKKSRGLREILAVRRRRWGENLKRQLETWAQQGRPGQFTDHIQRHPGESARQGRTILVADVEVFLQGSYGNDTNV